MSRTRPYVGRSLATRRLVVLRSDVTPTEETHGKEYAYTIGPFRTVRGARFMAEHGDGNPHCVTVAQAERLASMALVRWAGA